MEAQPNHMHPSEADRPEEQRFSAEPGSRFNPESPEDPLPYGLEWVSQPESQRRTRHMSLVLQAQGISHQTLRSASGWRLATATEQSEDAQQQLAKYQRENIGWPPRREKFVPVGEGSWAALLYAALLIVVYAFQTSGDFLGEVHGTPYLSMGRVDAARIFGLGEWWRCVTALTLHLDLVHVAGNLFFGALFLALVCEQVGPGTAGLAMLGGGAFGNLLNAAVQYPDHRAAGASTAVFAAIGLLSAHSWQRRRHSTNDRALRLGPLVIAVLLLAFLGVEGERTDVMAHVTGLLAGLLFGALLARFGPSRPRLKRELGMGLLSAAILAGCWLLAAL